MTEEQYEAINEERRRIFSEYDGISMSNKFQPPQTSVYFGVETEEAGRRLPKAILGVPVIWKVISQNKPHAKI